jgi:hypothetical protein
MDIQRVNRSDAEKIYINVQNAEGASISTGMGARFMGALGAEVVSTDGVQVCKIDADANFSQFSGIAEKDIASLGYGRLCVWGYCNSVLLSQETDKTIGVTTRAATFLRKGGALGTFTSTLDTGTNCSTLTVAGLMPFIRGVQNMATTNISSSLPYTKGFVRAL